MPNKKSAAKELRKAIKRGVVNQKMAAQMKNLVKTSLKMVKAGDKAIKQSYVKTIQAIDKAARQGVIKKNAAARKKSRLMKKINSLSK